MPFWETRFYVPAVLRNLWVYEGFAGQPTDDPERTGAASLADLPGPALISCGTGSPASASACPRLMRR